MSDDNKKMGIDDLDLSDLGTPVSEEKEPEESPQDDLISYWLNNKSIEKVTPEEMADWVSNMLPGTDPEGFSTVTFNNKQKRCSNIEKILFLYQSLQFPVKNKTMEYKN